MGSKAYGPVMTTTYQIADLMVTASFGALDTPAMRQPATAAGAPPAGHRAEPSALT